MKTAGFMLAALLVLAPAAFAEVRTHSGAKVSIDIPKEWKQKVDGDKLMMIEPKGDVLVAMRVLDATELKAAAAKVDATVADLVFDLTWQQQQQRNVNGLNAITIDGTGKLKSNGIAVNVMAAIVATPTNKLMLVLVIADSSKLQAHAGELKSILSSIGPAK